MTILKQSPHQSFQVTQLTPSVAICEVTAGDRYGWGNATHSSPAFLVYLGCTREEAQDYIRTFITFYRCPLCEVRQPKYLKDYEVEIKIRGMQRCSDARAFGLNYLIESEKAKDLGADYDEYNYYYSTGVVQRW